MSFTELLDVAFRFSSTKEISTHSVCEGYEKIIERREKRDYF